MPAGAGCPPETAAPSRAKFGMGLGKCGWPVLGCQAGHHAARSLALGPPRRNFGHLTGLKRDAARYLGRHRRCGHGEVRHGGMGNVVCRRAAAKLSAGPRMRVLKRHPAQPLAEVRAMTIDEFLRESGMTSAALARKLRCSKGTVSLWRYGHRHPNPRLMAELVRVTGGRVSDRDFPDQRRAGRPTRRVPGSDR